MNRQKHKLSRRILAVLLMAAMLITMLPSAMFAQNGNSGQETIYTDKQTAQEATGVTANKSVSGPDADGNYTITLTAKGGTSTSDVTKYLSADVALIIDSSGSMDFCGGTYMKKGGALLQNLSVIDVGMKADGIPMKVISVQKRIQRLKTAWIMLKMQQKVLPQVS